MADGLVLTRRLTERGVHETAQRAAGGAAAGVVTQYVGYEEWAESGFVRREMARYGVALILGFGDTMEVFDGEVESPVRSLRAFVVGNQSRFERHRRGGSPAGGPGRAEPSWCPGALRGRRGLERRGRAARRGPREAWGSPDRAVGGDGRLGGAPALLDEALGDGASMPALSPAVDSLRRALCASAGRARVEPLLDATGWSRRHVTAQFKRQLGISPKAYARLLRFEHARSLLTTLPRGRTLAGVAIESGYYDQSHLTRDFAALAGITPGAYAGGRALVPEVRFVQDAAVSDSA